MRPDAAVAVSPVVDPKMRVSLWGNYHEVWQGTLQEFCCAWKPDDALNLPPGTKLRPADVAELLAQQPREGMSCWVRSLPEPWFPCELRRPDAMVVLRRTHYYTDPKTGSTYTAAERIRGGYHWDRSGPIKATLGQSTQRMPLVTISTGFGFDGDYTPAQIRAFAQTLLRIADDAEAQPMGPRSFHRSVRGYDT